MTKQEAVKYFVEVNEPFSNYWSMQLAWTQFIDDLKMSDAITEKQRDNSGNPCTPETFKKFNYKFSYSKYDRR